MARGARDMTQEYSLQSADIPVDDFTESPTHRTVASYERELELHRNTERKLRDALAREEILLRQKDALIQRQDLLNKESDHRLLNGMQMIVSLLSLQSRAASNVEVALPLASAANRVSMVAIVHRRLHHLDGIRRVALKQYLEGLCCDFSAMVSLDQITDKVVVVEGIEADMPTTVAIPLAFIVSELITNAAKYGKGRISVKLEQTSSGPDYAVSVSNDGSILPEGYDPSASVGLGMRIIGSFVKQIGGELRIGRSDHDRGTRFTVLFSVAEN
jgi:two-component sensor histidine kinase